MCGVWDLRIAAPLRSVFGFTRLRRSESDEVGRLSEAMEPNGESISLAQES